MSSLDRVLARVDMRNFDNNIVGIIRSLRRYKIEDQRIDGVDGAMIEVIIAMAEEMDQLDEALLEMDSRLKSVEKVLDKALTDVMEKRNADAERDLEILNKLEEAAEDITAGEDLTKEKFEEAGDKIEKADKPAEKKTQTKKTGGKQ